MKKDENKTKKKEKKRRELPSDIGENRGARRVPHGNRRRNSRAPRSLLSPGRSSARLERCIKHYRHSVREPPSPPPSIEKLSSSHSMCSAPLNCLPACLLSLSLVLSGERGKERGRKREREVSKVENASASAATAL